MKKIFTLMVFVLIFHSLYAQKKPAVAPLNPDFKDYMEHKKAGKDFLKAYDGRYFGGRPAPAMVQFKPGAMTKDLPVSYDLRTEGGVTAVKDQGRCGACWAFATLGSMESRWLLQGFGTFDLSEDNLNNCHNFDWAPCEGGNIFISASMLARGKGPMSEADDPYSGISDNTCPLGLTPVAYVPDVWMPDTSINTIKQAILDYGAVHIGTYFHTASYNPVDYTYFYNETDQDPSEGGGHCVLLVGWDDQKSTAADDPGAWIVKNSWGTSWGESGYYYLSFHDSIGVQTTGIFPNRMAYDPEVAFLEYDELGWVTSLGYGDGTDHAIVRFEAGTNQQLQSIGTYATATGTILDIEIYDDFDGSALTGLRESLTDISCEFAGYYTLELPTPIDLTEGEEIFVHIVYQTGTYGFPIPVESNVEGYSSNAVIADSGSFWLSNDGTDWTGMGGDVKGLAYDPCVRAYTVLQEGALLADFTADVTSGEAPLTVQFSDESSGNITSWAWDFNGDGVSDATGQNPAYEYTQAGSYTVSLTVSDGTNTDTETKTDYITVTSALEADFTADVTSGQAPLSVQFTDQSIGDITSWAWDFTGDGTTDATTQNPSYVYTMDGTYTVGLTVSDGTNSDTETKPGYIQVGSEQRLGFAWDAYAESQNMTAGPVVVSTAGSISNIAENNGDFIAGADWADGKWYGCQYNTNALVTIDTLSGSLTTIATMSLNSPTGLAYDVSTDVMYVSDYDGTGSVLYEVDRTNGSLTQVGDILSSGLIIGIACDKDGNLYGVNLSADQFCSIDKTSGAATSIGDLGIQINYAQDIAFDRNANVLYGTLYEGSQNALSQASSIPPASASKAGGGLYTIDVATGSVTLVGSFVDELTGFAIPHDLSPTPGLEADFTANVTSGQAPLTVQFTDQSTGNVTSWAWDFNGDGITDATTQNPSHQYTQEGSYTVSLTVGDGTNSDTETKAGYIQVGGEQRLGFAWDAYSDSETTTPGPVKVSTTGVIANIAENTTDFIAGADWADGKWYGCQYSTNALVTIDTVNGNLTPIATMSLNSPTGLAYDVTSDVMYVSDYTSQANNVLYQVDRTTGSLTQVGQIMGTGGLVIGIACDKNGNLYGIDLANDQLLSINNTTGAGTVIGSLGININYAQDIAYDRQNNILYGTLYEGTKEAGRSLSLPPASAKAGGGLYLIDVNSGVASLIGTFVDELTAFAIPHDLSPTPGIEADFTADVTSGAAPLTVQFTDQSTGNVTSWAWDFNGDGMTDATTQNPSHQYTQAGTYTVRLTVSDGTNSDTETKSGYITVTGGLEADFTADVTSGAAPLTVQFTDQSTGNITSWAWDFNGDGLTDATTQNPSHQYTQAGTYTVSLTVSDGTNSDTETKSGYITVTGGLEADFTADVTSGEAPLTVQFTDQSTGNVTSWAWDFNGDGLTDAATQNPSHQYTQAGTYTVSLMVSDGTNSDTETKSGYITVTAGLEADFSADVTAGEAPLTVQFTDQSTGNVTSWAWDFNGDGTTDATTQNPQHQYSQADTFTVSLTVSDGVNSDTQTRPDYIVVVKPLAAEFTSDITFGYAPLTVQFTDQSTGAVVNWFWDLNGDGSTDKMSQNPSYVYQEPGTYDVSLSVSDGTNSLSTTKEDYIEVYPTVEADFSADVTSGTAPLTVNFTDQSTGNIISWKWDFDDDGTDDATEQNPSYTYQEAGTYSVSLSVSDGVQSGSKSRSDYITVDADTDVGALLQGKKAVVYPNPANQTTVVHLSEGIKVIRIELTNMEGKKLREWSGNELDQRPLRIEVADFSPGVYLVKVYLHERTMPLKLIIE